MDSTATRISLDGLYGQLAAADEAADPEALAQLAWQMYAELGTTQSDLAAVRARLTQVSQLATAS